LYTDAYITGEIRPASSQPYTFINALPSLNARSDSAPAHHVTLRTELHLAHDPDFPSLETTDTSRYHGGTFGGARPPAARQREDGRRKPSQHSYGHAIDIVSMTLADGRVLVVEDDWRGTIGDKPCGPESPDGT
jgi:hypothetical protein